MTTPNPGPATQSTGNVAGGPYGAWSGTITSAQIGPTGGLVPLGAFGALSAGANSITSGTAVFSNSNGVTFGISGQTVTASAAGGGVAAAAGANSVTSGTLVFSNLNGVTWGINGQTITASVPAQGGVQTGISSIADSANTQTVGMLSLANSNNFSWGLSTGANTATLTASFQQSVQTQASGAIAGSGFTTTTVAGAVVAGTNNSAGLKLAVPAYLTTETVTFIGAVMVSNTTYTSGTVSFSNVNGISFGSSAGQAVTASYTVPTMGVSTGGNTSGNTGIYSGQMVLAGGNNITLSVSSAAGGAQTITISAVTGNQTGISGIMVSNTTYTSGTVSFSNVNGISFGSSAGQAITASYTVPATAGLISGINVSATGGTSNNLSGLTFKDSNGVSFGLSTGASVGTLTASVAAQSNQTVGLYVTAQSTGQSSSTTLDARTISITPYGALSAGFSAASIQLSVPATSSLVGTNGFSASTNGSTIYVYPIAVSTYVPQWPASTSSLLINALGVSSANPIFFPFQVHDYVTFNGIAILESYSFVTSSSAASLTQQVQFGIFSNNASTWSLISSSNSSVKITNSGVSGTLSYATATSTSGYGYGTIGWSSTATAESSFGTLGFRNPIMQFGSNQSLTPGWYAIGLLSTASSSSANVGINQALIGNVIPISSMFGMGQSTTVTNQMLGMGYGTATTASLPGSMAFSNMTNSLGIIPIITLAST